MNRKVKAYLILKDIKQRDICKLLKVNPSTVSLIVSGKRKSERVRGAIAAALKMRVKDLWPDKTA